MVLADAFTVALVAWVRLVHGLYVAFLVAAPGLVWGGIATKNRFLTHPWLSVFHLACLVYVCLQLVFEWQCPLSLLESRLIGIPGPTRFLPVLWTLRTIPLALWGMMATAIAVNLVTQRAALRHRATLRSAEAQASGPCR